MATLGGIKPVEGNENSLEIESLARYAVDEHNKKKVLFLLNFTDFYVFLDEYL